jgi:hypothetical protein
MKCRLAAILPHHVVAVPTLIANCGITAAEIAAAKAKVLEVFLANFVAPDGV